MSLIRTSLRNLLSDDFERLSISKIDFLRRFIRDDHESELKELFKFIGSRKYKNIIIYPSAIPWEPMQRPQQFLKQLGKRGHLCIFCLNDNNQYLRLEEVCENVIIINKEELLVQAFSEEYVIFYITWPAQELITRFFNNSFIWYDIVDTIETFSYGKEKSFLNIHENLLSRADFLTYSSISLRPKEDALFAPNGVDIEAFETPSSEYGKKRANAYVYAGAMDPKWFDWDLVKYIAQKLPESKFYLLGKVPEKHIKLPDNVIFLGQVDYRELPMYLRRASVGIIPFKENNITNYVLPCKLFDYIAAGLPVVSIGLRELEIFNEEFIFTVSDKQQFVTALLKAKEIPSSDNTMKAFVERYHWGNIIETILAKMQKNISYFKTLANIDTRDAVNVASITFFDWEGENFYAGGAERYLIDLGEIAKELGIRYRIFQKGVFKWVRYYGGVEVVGLPTDDSKLPDDNDFSCRFYSKTIGRSLANIYSPFSLVANSKIYPSIGISHGIYWDGPTSCGNLDKFLIDVASRLDLFVSVDTNTANWFQTRSYEIGRKIKFPNYVNTEEFRPQNSRKEDGKVIISYPRRLYEPRGYYLVLEIIDKVCSLYPNVEFHFVGRGVEEDLKHLKTYQEKWGKRVQLYCKNPDEMFSVYQNSDICLIPTLYSEGTSLSCLEALATGNVVIATRIGGLTDLIINNYNGFLIEPDKDSLFSTISKILDNPSDISEIKENARRTAIAFNKNRWNDTWRNYLQNYIPEKNLKRTGNISPEEIHLSYRSRNDMLNDYELISRSLIAGKTLFIKIQNKDYNKKDSFGRLQFL